MFYIIATPIGNLADFSLRAVKTIEMCDYLLCEDTRVSRILLNHYDLKKPLKSAHQFNEASRIKQVLSDLQEGKTIGLLSDAGTPCISDPGYRLVEACHLHHYPVCPIPGASSVMAAICASGFNAARFQFVGFLPRKKGKLTSLFKECLEYNGISICFESPYRLVAALEQLSALSPTSRVFIGREMTKKFEQLVKTTASDAHQFFKNHPPKGECVLVIEGL